MNKFFPIIFWLTTLPLVVIISTCCVTNKPQGDGRISVKIPVIGPTNKVVGFNLEEGHKIITSYEYRDMLYIIDEAPDKTFKAWRYASNGMLIDNFSVKFTVNTNGTATITEE